jgi:acyl-CoA reductase-like NAD-dependent aldehyde dehydrogenase
MMGEVLEVAKDMETRSYREPLGVVASICPFSKRFLLIGASILTSL